MIQPDGPFSWSLECGNPILFRNGPSFTQTRRGTRSATSSVNNPAYGGESEGTPAVRRFMHKQMFFKEFRRELHRLLCSDGKTAMAQRESILKEAKIGQSSIAVTIASMIAPTLDTNGGVIAGAVAVSLAVIGRVGLSAWCATQSGSSECE
jgi:hypothetical protein